MLSDTNQQQTTTLRPLDTTTLKTMYETTKLESTTPDDITTTSIIPIMDENKTNGKKIQMNVVKYK